MAIFIWILISKASLRICVFSLPPSTGSHPEQIWVSENDFFLVHISVFRLKSRVTGIFWRWAGNFELKRQLWLSWVWGHLWCPFQDCQAERQQQYKNKPVFKGLSLGLPSTMMSHLQYSQWLILQLLLLSFWSKLLGGREVLTETLWEIKIPLSVMLYNSFAIRNLLSPWLLCYGFTCATHSWNSMVCFWNQESVTGDSL